MRAPDGLRGLLASPFRRGKKRVRVNAFERLVGKANLFEFAANLLKRQRWPAVPDRKQREGECAFNHQCDETYGEAALQPLMHVGVGGRVAHRKIWIDRQSVGEGKGVSG